VTGQCEWATSSFGSATGAGHELETNGSRRQWLCGRENDLQYPFLRTYIAVLVESGTLVRSAGHGRTEAANGLALPVVVRPSDEIVSPSPPL